MTTKNMSAAEARALADQLEAEERDRSTRKATAEKAGRLAAWEHERLTRGPELGTQRDQAEQTWRTLAADPAADVASLYAAWLALRTASQVNYRARWHSAVQADALDLERTYSDYGVETTTGRPKPMEDPYAAWAFADALEQVAKGHAESAAQDEIARAETTVADSAASAAAEA